MDSKRRVIGFFVSLLMLGAVLLLTQFLYFGSITGYFFYPVESEEKDEIIFREIYKESVGYNVIIDEGGYYFDGLIEKVEGIEGEVGIYGIDDEGSLWKSVDQGVSWLEIRVVDNNAHVVIKDKFRIIVLKGSVYKSENSGKDWSILN